jgi:hypothetical protein
VVVIYGSWHAISELLFLENTVAVPVHLQLKKEKENKGWQLFHSDIITDSNNGNSPVHSYYFFAYCSKYVTFANARDYMGDAVSSLGVAGNIS